MRTGGGWGELMMSYCFDLGILRLLVGLLYHPAGKLLENISTYIKIEAKRTESNQISHKAGFVKLSAAFSPSSDSISYGMRVKLRKNKINALLFSDSRIICAS